MMLVGARQMREELLAALGAAGAAASNTRRLPARNPVHTSVSPSGCKGGGHRTDKPVVDWIGYTRRGGQMAGLAVALWRGAPAVLDIKPGRAARACPRSPMGSLQSAVAAVCAH